MRNTRHTGAGSTGAGSTGAGSTGASTTLAQHIASATLMLSMALGMTTVPTQTTWAEITTPTTTPTTTLPIPDLTTFSSPAESIRIGNKYMENNKTTQAIEEYSRGLAKLLGGGGDNNSTPNINAASIAVQLESYLQRSTAYQQSGNVAKAINDLSEVINLNPEYKDALQRRAALYLSQGNFQEALTDYQRSSVLNPQNNSIADIAAIYLQQGDYGNSILEAQRALALNSNDSKALLTLANAMGAINNHSGALTLYKQYQNWATASPQNRQQAEDMGVVGSKIATTLLGLNDTENGIKEGEKLITQNRATLELVQKLLGVYKAQNDMQNATRMEKELNKQQQNLTSKEQYDMAVTAFRNMDYEESLRLTTLAIAQNSNARSYRLLKIQSLIYLQKVSEACTEAEQLCVDGYCPTITKLQSTSYCP